MLPPNRPSRPTNRHFWHTERAGNACAEEVWVSWTTLDDWPGFDDGVSTASLASGATTITATGQRGTLLDPTGRKVKFEVTAFSPGSFYTFTSQLPLAKLHVHRILTELGGEVSVTHEVWFGGPLALVWAGLLGRKFRGMLPGVVRKLVVLAEAEVRAGKPTNESNPR